MKTILLLPMVTLSLGAVELTKEQNSEMRQLYLQNACNSCHGNYGEGMGASPRLQGLKEEVLFDRLKDLQQGKTRTAFGTIMISFAKSLTPEQTRLMAKYLAKLETEIPEERYEIEFTREGDGGS
ncbi:MAG: c-type cytochrome [Sulfurovum sp.]|nr:c-type cytochrome [Sulfurovum sp.]